MKDPRLLLRTVSPPVDQDGEDTVCWSSIHNSDHRAIICWWGQFQAHHGLDTGDVEGGRTFMEDRSCSRTGAGFAIQSTTKGPTNCGASFLHSTRRGRSCQTRCPGSKTQHRLACAGMSAKGRHVPAPRLSGYDEDEPAFLSW